jgi:hypothetical protein
MAGTLTHRVSTTVRSNAGSVTSTSYTLTGDHEFNYEIEDKSVGTDTQIDMALDVSTIVSLAIESSVAMTIETNAVDATGGDTITLAANTPLIWNTTLESTLGVACPLTLDVTTAYVTNAAIGDLSIYVLMNGA